MCPKPAAGPDHRLKSRDTVAAQRLTPFAQDQFIIVPGNQSAICGHTMIKAITAIMSNT